MKKNIKNRRCNSEARFFKVSNDRGDTFPLTGTNNGITRFSRIPEIRQRTWTVQVSGLSLAFSKYKELAEALSVDVKLLETGQKSFSNGVMAVSFATADGATIQALKLSPFRHILSRALTVAVSPETLPRSSTETITLLPDFMSMMTQGRIADHKRNHDQDDARLEQSAFQGSARAEPGPRANVLRPPGVEPDVQAAIIEKKQLQPAGVEPVQQASDVEQKPLQPAEVAGPDSKTSVVDQSLEPVIMRRARN